MSDIKLDVFSSNVNLDALVDDSVRYASDRDGMDGMGRVDEVAMAYRDGYRVALGDIKKSIARMTDGIRTERDR
jgi:hypothetical protein